MIRILTAILQKASTGFVPLGRSSFKGRGKTDNAVNIISAQDVTGNDSKNKSYSANAGIAIAFGDGVSFGVTAGASYGKGKSNTDTVTQHNSHVGSGGLTTIESGGTTTLAGGQVTGKRVEVDAKDLVITSLQDTSKAHSDQFDASLQVTVGYGFSASGSLAMSKSNADYASVGEQSGIIAGDGGYRVNVKNATNITGGIVTSSQQAEDAGLNSFTTGTLTTADVANHADYSASGFGIGGGVETKGGWTGQGSQNTNVNKSIGIGSDSDHDSSVTQAGINTRNIVITDAAGQAATGKSVEQVKADVATNVVTDTVADNSGHIDNNYDAQAVQDEINLQVRVSQKFDQNRQEAKAEIYAKAKDKRDQATALRKENGGYDTEESIALDKQAANLQKGAMWLDIAAAGLYGWGNTTALVSGAAVTQADLARRALTADKKILLQQCDAGGQNCTHREVDASQVTVLNGKVYVFNNGIFNDEDMALNNARLQSTDSANAQGVYVIINPKTGNPVAELFYAGYDKINEIMGGAMPISNASEVNQSILQTAATQNGTMDSVNHSRGGLTFANAVGDLNQQGVTDAPIGSVQFNGSAANAQRTANIVDTVSGGQGTVSYSTHATDLVPRIVGGNPATGGNPNFSFPKSHSSYTGYLPPEMVMSDEGVLVANPDRLFTDAAWGNGNTSTTITVKPHDRFKSKSKE